MSKTNGPSDGNVKLNRPWMHCGGAVVSKTNGDDMTHAWYLMKPTCAHGTIVSLFGCLSGSVDVSVRFLEYSSVSSGPVLPQFQVFSSTNTCQLEKCVSTCKRLCVVKFWSAS